MYKHKIKYKNNKGQDHCKSCFNVWIRNEEDFKFKELGSRLDFGLIKIDIKE